MDQNVLNLKTLFERTAHPEGECGLRFNDPEDDGTDQLTVSVMPTHASTPERALDLLSILALNLAMHYGLPLGIVHTFLTDLYRKAGNPLGAPLSTYALGKLQLNRANHALRAFNSSPYRFLRRLRSGGRFFRLRVWLLDRTFRLLFPGVTAKKTDR